MKSSALNHLIDLERFPGQTASSQAAYDRKRMQDIETSKLSRPHFLPVQIALPGAVQTLPLSAQTEDLNHNVVIFGGISDAEARKGSFYRRRNEEAFVDAGEEAGVRLSIDALGGKSVAAAGTPGVQRFVTPFRLIEHDTLTVEVYQETNVADVVSFVFNGIRVFTPQHADGQLSQAERSQVQQAIARYASPQPRFLVAPVTFNGGKATTQTPKHDEPLLIYGFRSTFTDAMVNFGLSSSDSFSNSSFPIWALCAEPNNGQMLFQHLMFPIFVPARQQLYFRLENTIDGTNFATDGQIEMLAATP
jgi:hypothetical protein